MEFLNLLNPEFLIKSFGLLGIFGIVFAESGLLFGFFFPGDSLLLTAGLFASRGDLSIAVVAFVCALGAVLGDSAGYWFGRKTGERIFQREESRFFKKSHLLKAQEFYNRHGGKTIVIARFMPFIRTFAPIVAGAAGMDYSKFLLFNVLGGALWGAGLPLMGFSLGTWLAGILTPKQADNYFLLIILAVIALSVAPTAIHILKSPASRSQIAKSLLSLIYALPGLNSNRKS